MKEATIRPGVLEPYSEGETSSDDDLIQEVEGYTESGEMERVVHPQGTEGDLPPVTRSTRIMSSTSVRASTSGA